MWKRITITLCALTILSSISMSAPVVATQLEASGQNFSETVQPRTDIKEWLYKVMNGNLYKRLYNYSTGRWETDWIFVASGVEEL
ncbi:MAG TPA: hypothetical protein IAC80_06325 [Candidatus Merdiplasma excrementigallinarum]|uniref:Uncharacterized protein n=1 Tax=Candidatus Merdiplasma excrementigallinarum TaxID=2840864 RepID=A0A9D1NYT3_9FIRM|nr:hypothetical protein [Candidatus Merdiplasma excrementigallinarum]